MSRDPGRGGGRDADIGAWLPIIGGVVVGAGILTVVYLFSKSGREPEIEPTQKEKPQVTHKDGKYCPKIDPKRRRWPTKEQEEELKRQELERQKRCEEWRKQCLAIRLEEERKRQEECEMLRKQQREEQRRRQEECEMLRRQRQEEECRRQEEERRRQEEERRREEECRQQELEEERRRQEECEMEPEDDWCEDEYNY